MIWKNEVLITDFPQTVPLIEILTRFLTQIKTWIDVSSEPWLFEGFLSDFEEGAFLGVTDVFPGVGNDEFFLHLSKRLDFQFKQLGP